MMPVSTGGGKKRSLSGNTPHTIGQTTAAYTPKGTDFSDIPQVVILYITEYDALHNGQMITRVKRCMDTQEGYVLVDDGEEIFFANTVHSIFTFFHLTNPYILL